MGMVLSPPLPLPSYSLEDGPLADTKVTPSREGPDSMSPVWTHRSDSHRLARPQAPRIVRRGSRGRRRFGLRHARSVPRWGRYRWLSAS